MIPAIVKFVNILGETRYGIVTEREPSGMLHIIWDEFTELLKRIGGSGRASDADYRMLGVTRGWIRPEAQDVNTKLELLPINAKVTWVDAQMSKLHKQVQSGAALEPLSPPVPAPEGVAAPVDNVFRGQVVE